MELNVEKKSIMVNLCMRSLRELIHPTDIHVAVRKIVLEGKLPENESAGIEKKNSVTDNHTSGCRLVYTWKRSH